MCLQAAVAVREELEATLETSRKDFGKAEEKLSVQREELADSLARHEALAASLQDLTQVRLIGRQAGRRGGAGRGVMAGEGGGGGGGYEGGGQVGQVWARRQWTGRGKICMYLCVMISTASCPCVMT